MSLKSGLKSEQQARTYLLAQGLGWIESNYRCRWGELDLIMQDKNYLVFVEVRARVSSSFGGAAASVTPSKQRKLIKTASSYLLSRKRYEKQPIRFDVLGFEGSELQIVWLKNAFGLDF
jgi:putative endonuclease